MSELAGGLIVSALIVVCAWLIYRFDVKPFEIRPGVTFYPWTGYERVTDIAKWLQSVDLSKFDDRKGDGTKV